MNLEMDCSWEGRHMGLGPLFTSDFKDQIDERLVDKHIRPQVQQSERSNLEEVENFLFFLS